eukprot:scaffold8889_cov100-Isochrysis_galbana.AAC.2
MMCSTAEAKSSTRLPGRGPAAAAPPTVGSRKPPWRGSSYVRTVQPVINTKRPVATEGERTLPYNNAHTHTRHTKHTIMAKHSKPPIAR